MFTALPYKTKQFFFVLIKLSIVVGAFYFIYHKLDENKDLEFSVFIQFLKENKVFSSKNILFLVILSLFNWFFEIVKWQHLVSIIKKTTFIQALEQSLASLTASLFTPNRIGEYGAKPIYFPKSYRKRIVLLNFIGNCSQMLITFVFGITGLLLFLNMYDIPIDYFNLAKIGFVIVVIALLFAVGLKQNLFKIKGFSVVRIKAFIGSISLNSKLFVIGCSLVRYLIFTYQFYLLLTIFGIEVNYARAMIVISSMYLLTSIVPTISIFDVVVKGSVAVYLFGLVGVNEISILCITLMMWILNFVLPSMFGSYYVLNFNLKHLNE